MVAKVEDLHHDGSGTSPGAGRGGAKGRGVGSGGDA